MPGLHLYPALIDVYGDFTRVAKEPRHIYLPVGVERFRCANVRAREVWVHGVHRQPAHGGPEISTVDITIYDDEGRFAAAIEGLSLKLLSAEALRPPATAGKADFRGHTSQSGVAATTAPGMDAAAIRRGLQEATRERRRELLVGLVRQLAMKTLGVTELIEPARPLRELGFHSR